jgi:membrane-associated protein
MVLALNIVDVFLHIDKYLGDVVKQYDQWTYLILFIIIFCETGLVVTPFLPGDSLLFAAGAIAATTGSLNAPVLFCLLALAAITGNEVNYRIGRLVGPKVFHKDTGWFLKKEYLERTHRFYEKHGAITICIARFMPIIRTFAPFVAGIGAMKYWRFAIYNAAAGILWVGSFVFCGYWFGTREIVKKNFSLVILAIIIISLLPGTIAFIRERTSTRKARAAAGEESSVVAQRKGRDE